MADYGMLHAAGLEGRAAAKDGIIIDVRTHMEHGEKRLARAHAHVPLDELKPRDFMMRHGMDSDADVYLLCRSGGRASQAAEKFVAEGYKNVHVVEGGLTACEECGLAVEGAVAAGESSAPAVKALIPLERQVRIAAGLLAALGGVLALWVHPLFAFVSILVGAGMVFSGVTNRCGMALMLTYAPWNKPVAGTACAMSSGKKGQSCQ